MTPDPIDGTGVLPAVLLVALCLWTLAALVLGPLVGRAIRRARRTGGPTTLWDRHGDQWDRNTDGTYRLHADNSDQLLQAMDLDDVEEAFGPITLEPQLKTGAET